MQRVPYALIRLDAPRGGVLGMMVVSPYHAAIHWLSDDLPEPLPTDHFSTGILVELSRLAAAQVGQAITVALAEETAYLCEEFGRRTNAFALCVEDVTLAGPSFAPARLHVRLLEWVVAERSGSPLCPFRCAHCDERLERWGTNAVADPTSIRQLQYACREHPTQESSYDAASRKWTNLRT